MSCLQYDETCASGRRGRVQGQGLEEGLDHDFTDWASSLAIAPHPPTRKWRQFGEIPMLCFGVCLKLAWIRAWFLPCAEHTNLDQQLTMATISAFLTNLQSKFQSAMHLSLCWDPGSYGGNDYNLGLCCSGDSGLAAVLPVCASLETRALCNRLGRGSP